MSLRAAVTLPSHEAGSCHRQQLDAAICALIEQGVEVECFAEDSRLRESEPGFDRWHYLRIPERHAAQPFDAVLCPLGRDYRPYEPSWIGLHQMPATVWVLDPVLHHLIVGGMVLRGRWDAYRAAMVQAFGARGPAFSDVLSSWWTTPSFYARHDPLPALLSDSRVVAASPAIAGTWSGSGLVGTVPLPSPAAGEGRAPVERVRRLAILALSLARPEPLLRGIRDALARDPELVVTVAAPELVHRHRLDPSCRRLGELERTQWLLGGSWSDLRQLAMASDAVGFLGSDLSLPEDALLRCSLAAGKVGLVLETTAFADYPRHAVVKISPGNELSASLPALLQELSTDGRLATALGRAGQRFEAVRADPARVGEALASALRASANAGPVKIRDLAAEARSQLADRVRRRLPNTSSRHRATEIVATALGARWCDPGERT